MDDAPKEPPRPRRYLSGIQPSGDLHLGNYFGAIRQHVANQVPGQSFYFIANYHALTTVHDAERLRALTFDVAAAYLALGLDPARSVFFRQSDVPEVTELTWLLLSVTPFNDLELAHSFKDKVARGLSRSGGLFVYPALMAADILAYDSTVVPVGADQVQHIEMTREMARLFNHHYGQEVFVLPNAELAEAAVVPGLDGAKMSKSYGNTIPIFLSGKPLKKLVMSMPTDSTPLEAPKDPDTCNVFKLWSLFATADERAALAARYRAGGFGYGEAKNALYQRIEDYFAGARGRFERLQQSRGDVEDVLRAGAQRARAVARATTDRARRAAGVA